MRSLLSTAQPGRDLRLACFDVLIRVFVYILASLISKNDVNTRQVDAGWFRLKKCKIEVVFGS